MLHTPSLPPLDTLSLCLPVLILERPYSSAAFPSSSPLAPPPLCRQPVSRSAGRCHSPLPPFDAFPLLLPGRIFKKHVSPCCCALVSPPSPPHPLCERRVGSRQGVVVLIHQHRLHLVPPCRTQRDRLVCNGLETNRLGGSHDATACEDNTRLDILDAVLRGAVEESLGVKGE